MKTIVLCLSAIILCAAGCSKSSTSATTGRDAFVGNYHMHDSIIRNTGNFGGMNHYDTSGMRYDMQVLAVPGTSDRAIFNNIGGSGSDTATVSGSLATFTNGLPYATTASLSGSTITMSLVGYGGTIVYSSSTGTKF